MVPLWWFHDDVGASIASVVLPWDLHGDSMALSCCFHGAAMGLSWLPWCFHGALTACVLPWYFHGGFHGAFMESFITIHEIYTKASCAPRQSPHKKTKCISCIFGVEYDATRRTSERKIVQPTRNTNLRCDQLFVFFFQSCPLDLQLPQGLLHVGDLCGPGRQSVHARSINRERCGGASR